MPETKEQGMSNAELIDLAYQHFGWCFSLEEITQMVANARDFPDFLPLIADKRFEQKGVQN